MGTTPAKKDIAVQDGQAITGEAATWKGTPYKLNGPAAMKAIGGDCSGTTLKIYQVAKFPYEYKMAHDFPDYATASGLFRELAVGEMKQDGDILSWHNHMAIYCTFAADPDDATTQRQRKDGKGTWTQNNDMWTASKPGGPAYATAEMRWWRPDAPRVFRYQK
jgi:hypothetical protein